MHERINILRNAALAAVLVAACSTEVKPTPVVTPNATPSEAPTPTLVVTPSPEATPTATPEATPTPTPEATPVTMSGLVDQLVQEAKANGGYKKVSSTTVANSIKAAFTADPDAANSIADSRSPNTTLSDATNNFWFQCRTGNFPDGTNPGGNPNNNKMIGCIFTATDLFRGFSKNKNPLFLSAFENVVAWSQNNLPSPQKESEIDQLKSFPL